MGDGNTPLHQTPPVSLTLPWGFGMGSKFGSKSNRNLGGGARIRFDIGSKSDQILQGVSRGIFGGVRNRFESDLARGPHVGLLDGGICVSYV